MSGPRRRKFVRPIISRVTWHGGRGTPYLRRWVLIVALDPLDDFLAEDAVGPNHEGDDHQDVRREVLGATAHVGIHIPGGDVLDNAHDEAADDGPRNGIEAAEDDHRKHLEADQSEVHVDPDDVPPN